MEIWQIIVLIICMLAFFTGGYIIGVRMSIKTMTKEQCERLLDILKDRESRKY